MTTLAEEVEEIMANPNFTVNVKETKYKIGLRDMIFRWSPVYHEWIRSALTIGVLRARVRDKIRHRREKQFKLRKELNNETS